MLKVSLYNDFSVFGASSHTAFTFKEFAQFFQIVFRTDKSGNESYNFTAPVLAVQLYAQTLLGRLESGLLFFIVQFVFEVGVAEVKKQFGDYLEDVIYMPIVDLDASGAEKHIEAFIKDMSPVAFELLFVKDTNLLPKKLATTLNGRSLIWYNTLWDTMAGGHDDDMSLQNPDSGYGYLIDTLGCRIIQTDRPAYLLDYLRKRKLHD